MALNKRQTKLYVHRVSVYRASKVARNASGELLYASVTTGVPCYHFTTSNADIITGAVGRLKKENIMTLDRLHFEQSVDIRPEDYIQFTDTGNDHTNVWYVVLGDKQSRLASGVRSTNHAAVYITQSKAPVTT